MLSNKIIYKKVFVLLCVKFHEEFVIYLKIDNVINEKCEVTICIIIKNIVVWPCEMCSCINIIYMTTNMMSELRNLKFPNRSPF